MTTADTAAALVLHISANGGWNYATVTFSGPKADEIAADYIGRKGHLVIDVPEDADLGDFPLTVAALDPSCQHGMSLRLCYGPNHYPTEAELYR